MSFPIRRARWESDPEVLSRIGTPAMIGIISSVISPQTSHQSWPGPANGQFSESYHDREIDSRVPIQHARWDITPSFPIMIGLAGLIGSFLAFWALKGAIRTAPALRIVGSISPIMIGKSIAESLSSTRVGTSRPVSLS